MPFALAAAPRVDVPEDAFSGDQPLVAVLRGDHVGSLHRGTIVVVSSEGEVRLRLGDPNQQVYLRSAAKPFQILPAVLVGAIERFGISAQELAVLCASHNAEPRHTDAVQSVLRRIGLPESALACGVHPPLHEETARRIWRDGGEPSPVCNNCSGAHAGMLAACQANGWSTEGYGSPDHPLQQQTRAILADFAGLRAEQVGMATDNCHVPTFYLPLQNAAIAFARLASGTGIGSEYRQAAEAVVNAMTSHPGMVGGKNRFDSDLMAAAEGAVVAKGGAEGFQGVGLVGDPGWGMAIKVSDGNSRAVPPAAMRILDHLGVINSEQSDRLQAYREPVTSDLQSEVVGRLVPVFSCGALSSSEKVIR